MVPTTMCISTALYKLMYLRVPATALLCTWPHHLPQKYPRKTVTNSNDQIIKDGCHIMDQRWLIKVLHLYSNLRFSEFPDVWSLPPCKGAPCMLAHVGTHYSVCEFQKISWKTVTKLHRYSTRHQLVLLFNWRIIPPWRLLEATKLAVRIYSFQLFNFCYFHNVPASFSSA